MDSIPPGTRGLGSQPQLGKVMPFGSGNSVAFMVLGCGIMDGERLG